MKTFANHTDEELALLYIAGDNKAFDELLARNQQKLFNYIFFVVGDYEVANDIFQDAFAKDTVHNGIVDAYKDRIKAVLESNATDAAVRDVLSIFDSDNNRHPANMASFLFSLCDNQNLKAVNKKKIDFNYCILRRLLKEKLNIQNIQQVITFYNEFFRKTTHLQRKILIPYQKRQLH